MRAGASEIGSHLTGAIMASAWKIDNRQCSRFAASSRAASTSDSARRMKSEIISQFCPEPIDEPIFLDSGSVSGDERFGFLNTPVQAVKIGKQECIVEIEYAAILLALQKPNCSSDVPLRQRARN